MRFIKLRLSKFPILNRVKTRCLHLTGIKLLSFFIKGASSVSVKVQVQSNSAVDQEHIDLATRFGVDLGDPTASVEAKKYVVAFLQKIFMQREKINLGHLTDYLQSGDLH